MFSLAVKLRLLICFCVSSLTEQLIERRKYVLHLHQEEQPFQYCTLTRDYQVT